MYWADKLIQKLPRDKQHRVDDMKTPSGHAHAGSLRAISTHGLVYEAMKRAGFDVEFTYVVNDMDPMDGLPRYLDEEEYRPHMGKPVYTIPAPDGVSENFATQYANEYIGAFNRIGFKPQIFWSSKLYAEGLMNDYIRIALNSVEEIRKVYKDVADQDKPEGWYPFQVICPNCGKVGSSLVTDWDGEQVTYECKADLVEWAVGCGHTGKVSPFNGTGKLMWKVDWPAHWAALNITVEGAGKDHFSAGGSRDIGTEIIKRVYDVDPPFGFLHEFLLIGGAKMSSSKGNATTSAEFVEFFPAEVGKFLFVRTPYQRAINFDPSMSNTIPDLFDEYDRCAEHWFATQDETDYGRMFEAAQIGEVPTEKTYFPRFRQVATLMQMPSVDLIKFFTDDKGSELTERELELLDERKRYAQIWLENFASEDDIYSIADELPEAAKDLSEEQRKYLAALADMLETNEYSSGDDLQQAVFELGKSMDIPSKQFFQAIYVVLLAKTHGPKAGWIIFDQLSDNKEMILNRFREVSEKSSHDIKSNIFQQLNDSNRLIITSQVREKWPTITVGYAEIRNVKIEQSNPELEELKKEVLAELSQLSREDINQMPELVSFRNLYKETGIDWHSRRPSPEALLRRLTQGKDLYQVNTCVDAYNLIVMRNRVSVGAFDMDNLQLPTQLQLASGGEEITLLGDSEPTIIKEGELCYFDQTGPYNLDFNYRDADRTKVTLNTTNLLINVEGVYDISRNQVEQSLQETIDIIMRFCGGELIKTGIVN
ncbi:lysine--tRNA ligase [Candidatus Dojkabacteria bacterium]|uniref:Lysine--tRNA ligase n=1 Tax=Candidatus Dojkabacteria bacterium TaxID=2099670 RepID=A0A955L556_9BACT|nr:lysine--tRNA ligase [Candidatus Dojkabacteria bacterium]